MTNATIQLGTAGSDGPAPFLPSRLTPADRARIETRVQAIGRELLAAALAARPSVMSPEYWAEQAGEWATADDELKVRLFRLVDCMPMLDDPAAVDRHLREYIDDEVIDRMPAGLGMALKASRTRVLAPLAARAVRAAMLAQAKRFIAGTTPTEAARAALAERRRHRGFTLDLLGETVTSEAEADAYATAYARLLTELPAQAAAWPHDPLVDDGPPAYDRPTPLPRVNVSLKLSALDSRFDAIDPAGTTERVLARLRPLWRLARDSAAQIHVDMESHATKDLTLSIFKQIAMEDEFREWPHCGIVVQCYLHESTRDLPALAAWARGRGTPVCVRLVKGAYWDYETIHARAAGWPIPVWEEKWQTDACYEAATTFAMEHADLLRPALGSHNLRSLAHGMAVAEHLGLDRRTVEMQMLYGMGDAEKEAVTKAGWRMRVYMPYGELVPGMAYLVRRLLENSSNESFLRAGFIQQVEAEVLLAAPTPHVAPSSAPAATCGGAAAEFANEPLADFSVEANRDALQRAVVRFGTTLAERPSRVPVVIDGRTVETADRSIRENPSDRRQTVAEVSLASVDDAVRALTVAREALPAWRATDVGRRAEILRAAASIMRARKWELAATQVFEVGKPWREADADVAEAIDFCEYYARQATVLFEPRRVNVPGEENATNHLSRGVAVVIAPWNFPLAILAGMTTAALVTGNTVVMKPAEQASLVAKQLHEILLAAGIPPAALAFLPGRGEVVGPVLVSHRDTALVAFTGSRAVGLAINRLAAEATGGEARLVKRVIAEMGGKNSIIVDDDADLDEAVVAVAQSAFGFQGQKCSACSRVIVLDRVHDAFVARLAGAVGSLHVGPAVDPGTRIGPLVDEEALTRVRSFIDVGRRTAREVIAVEVAGLGDQGWFVGPHVFADVDPVGPLGQDEIFGPVLAVLRARDFDHAIALANDTPYALTAGVFSRSPARLALARTTLEAGNIYLNRGITGALVHRQPFGGYRMSGIGSKTGGADYLQQFVVPRTVTENTMRRGFAPVRPAADGRRQ
ncbi:MAG: proline dehydrogenase family protein [Planctomycetia bacterium]|nr:proline dehydrogenase family protein [Planctomycetia bacterium]